jgi:hypothetical protein
LCRSSIKHSFAHQEIGESSIKRALVIGICFRIALFIFALIYPITNESGDPVSAQVVQQTLDFSFYKNSVEKLFFQPFSEMARNMVLSYENPFSYQPGITVAAPLFPALIVVFDYRDGNTVPLAIFYLALGYMLLSIWLIWLKKLAVPEPFLILFAVLPNPLWFTLNISSDLPFAVLMAAFYLAYFRPQGEDRYWIIWGVALLLMMLTRPNGLSLMLFVLIHQAIRAYQLQKVNIPALVFLTLIALAAGLYLLPYFNSVLDGMPDENIAYTYFGHTTLAYLDGIYEALPKWLDLPLSWLALIAAKLLYFVGLRPSFGDVAWWIVMLRGGAGLILLPGLIWIAVRGDNKHRLLIGLFLLPFIIGPSQDRYNLAIQPLLFYFGYLALRDVLALRLRRG